MNTKIVLFILLLIHLCFQSRGQDSTRKKVPFVYEANVKAGYHYGFIQGYTFDQDFPDQLFLTEGNAGFNLFKLPFQVEYRYATLKIPYGLNNYFRIKFDAEKYMREVEEMKKKLDVRKKIKLDTLYTLKQELTKKLLYRQYKINELNRLYPNLPKLPDVPAIPSMPDSLQVPDSLKMNVPSIVIPDSLKPILPKQPNLNFLADSLARLKSEYELFTQQINKIENALDSLKQINDLLDKLPKGVPNIESNLNKYKKPPFKLHNLELGTCYPSNSYLLYGTLPVNGFFTEMEVKGMYVSALYGEVINNFLFASTYFERQLMSTKNVTNFFDFANTNHGRKITAIKIGKGTFNSNHIHLGVLYGIGLKNYGDTLTINQDVIAKPKETNLVFELTSRYSKGRNRFDFALAKSAVSDYRSGTLTKALTDLSTYSFAGYLGYTTSFFKGKTSLSVIAKHLQPYYRSFGLGFVNNDFLRLNVKVTQVLTKKMTLTVFGRNDIDNLYNLVAVTNNILNFGANTQIRIGRSLQLRFIYNPIIQKVENHSLNQILFFRNYLYTGSISYNKRIRKSNLQSSLNFNYFEINSFNSVTNKFQNVIFTNTFSKGKLTMSATSSYFSTNIIDSVGRNNLMNSLIVLYNIKKVGIKAGIKHYSNLGSVSDIGYSFGLTVPVYKGVSLMVEGQKFVVGDYFLANNAILNKVPYYFSAALNFRW